MPKAIKRIIAFFVCVSLLFSLIGCSSNKGDSNVSPTSYVNEAGNLVVDGVEIRDSFVRLQIDPLVVNEAKVVEMSVDEVMVHCVNVKEITVLEAEVVSLSDDFVYL